MNAASTISEIQVLNTMAVMHISQGDHEEAIEALTYAISQLSWCQLSPTPIGGKSTEIAHHHGRPSHGVSIYSSESMTGADFFPHPWIFELASSRDQDEPSLTNEQYCFSAMVCLFNLGLCYQLEWHTNQSEGHLLKAVQCYDQACSLTSNCRLLPGEKVLHVLTAACANATHAYSELANMPQVKVWNNRLRQVLGFSGRTQDFAFHAFVNSFSGVAAPAA